MKKAVLVLVIFTLIGTAVFSQEEEVFKKNTVALYATVLGTAFNYEYSFNPYLSVLADTSLNLFPATVTAAAKGRWYPFGKTFFLEMGAGFGLTAGYMGFTSALLVRTMTLGFVGIEDKVWLRGVVVTPSLGWKIRLGKEKNLCLPISLGIDFFAGSRELEIPVDFVFNARIGFGYIF